MDTPLTFQWTGEAMIPASPYWAARCDKQLVVGETYRMVEHNESSTATRNHYFASIKNGFDSLPDHMKGEYPTVEHLRKKALIRCGYRDERDIVLASKAEAERVAAFMSPMDSYSIVVPSACVVRVWTAKSQKRAAMGADEFQKSKVAVLDFIDDLLGVERGSTAKAAA